MSDGDVACELDFGDVTWVMVCVCVCFFCRFVVSAFFEGGFPQTLSPASLSQCPSHAHTHTLSLSYTHPLIFYIVPLDSLLDPDRSITKNKTKPPALFNI